MADEYKLKLIKLPALQSTAKNLEPLKPYAEDEQKILAAAFATNEGEASPLSDLKTGQMFTLRVDKVTPAKAKDLSSIKSDITQKYLADRKRRSLLMSAMQMTEDLDRNKTTLGALAKKNSIQVETSFVSRIAAPTNLDKADVGKIMAADPNKSIVLPKDKSLIIAKIVKVSFPDDAQADAKKDETLLSELKEDRFISYVSNLEARSKVEINRPLLDQVYGQPAEDQTQE